MPMSDVIAQTAASLQLDLIEIERTAGGTLRITIDWPWDAAAAEHPAIGVEDCERMTRQLQYALEVEAIDYKRLEVASPGIDRPLRHELDLQRFAGEAIDLVLKAPVGADLAKASGGTVGAARKRFRGVLRQAAGSMESAVGWELVVDDTLADRKPGGANKPLSKTQQKKLAGKVDQVLGFVWSEVASARLAPIVDFSGRKPRLA
jgi:ribosome maturation factor RimP